MSNTILIAEDDNYQLKMLTECFASAGFTVYTAQTCKEAVISLYRHEPDCFLLDYHLQDDTAQFVCLSIRSHIPTKDAPIVMLSGDELQGENSYNSCQVDAFLVKGHGCGEALAAIKRHLRRVEAVKGLGRHSDLVLDYKNTAISIAGKPPIYISPQQFRFFAGIFEKSPKFVTEFEILARVFSIAGETGTPEALNMVAHRLRVKLGARLARRIKHSKSHGWIYIEPRRNKISSGRSCENRTQV